MVLEILPQLAPGVLVHVHDMYLPYDYALSVFNQGKFWTEQYLLQAYLCENPHVEILVDNQPSMHHREELLRLFAMLEDIWGASLWFRKSETTH